MTNHNLADYVDHLLDAPSARHLIEAYTGMANANPSSLADLAAQERRSRQAIHARILRQLEVIANMDRDAGSPLRHVSHRILHHMATAGIGYSPQTANRVPDRFTAELVATGAITPSEAPHIRLAVMVEPLQVQKLGAPLGDVHQRVRQVMLPATHAMSEDDIRHRLQFYRVAHRAISTWRSLALATCINRTCGVQPDAEGLYPTGAPWAEGMATRLACTACAVLALRHAGHAMPITQLAEAAQQEAGHHIPPGHDVPRSIRRHLTRQPELHRSNGRIRLIEREQCRFTSNGLKRTVAEEIQLTLERYGPMPFPTLAHTVPSATRRAISYAKHRIRQPKPGEPWRVLPTGLVALHSTANSTAPPREPNAKEVCPRPQRHQPVVPPRNHLHHEHQQARPAQLADQNSPTFTQGAQ